MAESFTTRSSSQAYQPNVVRNLESSQLPANQHDIYLLRFLSLPVTYQMVTYIAAYTTAIVDDVLHTLPTPPETSNSCRMPDLEDFIVHVCRQSNVSTSTLMVSVIYLARLRNCMPYQALGKDNITSSAISGGAHLQNFFSNAGHCSSPLSRRFDYFLKVLQ